MNINQNNPNIGGNANLSISSDVDQTNTNQTSKKNLSILADQIVPLEHGPGIHKNFNTPALSESSNTQSTKGQQPSDTQNLPENQGSSPASETMGLMTTLLTPAQIKELDNQEMSVMNFMEILQKVMFALYKQMLEEGKVPDALDKKYINGMFNTWFEAKKDHFAALHPNFATMDKAQKGLVKVKKENQSAGNQLVKLLESIGVTSHSTTIKKDPQSQTNSYLKSLQTELHKMFSKEAGILGKPLVKLMTDSNEGLQNTITEGLLQQFTEILKPIEKLLNQTLAPNLSETLNNSNLSPDEKEAFKNVVTNTAVTVTIQQSLTEKPDQALSQEFLQKVIKEFLDTQNIANPEFKTLLLQFFKNSNVLKNINAASVEVSENLGQTKKSSDLTLDNFSV